MAGIAEAGISAGAGLVGGIVNGLFQKKAQERSYNYNMQLQQQNQQFEKEMWEATNAYNSPVQQMARLSEAGLNPNMVYGQTSAGAAGQASVPHTGQNAVSIQPVQVDLNSIVQNAANVYRTINESKLAAANVAAAGAAAQKDLADAAKKLAETPGARAVSEQMQMFASRYSEYLELQLSNSAQDLQVKQALSNQYAWTAQELQYRVEELLPAQKREVEQAITESVARIKQKWQELQIQSRFASAAERQAKAAETNAAAAVMNAHTNQYNAETQRNLANSQIDLNNANVNVAKQEELLKFAQTEEQKIANRFSGLGIDPKLGGLAGSFVRSAASLVGLGGTALGDTYFTPKEK